MCDRGDEAHFLSAADRDSDSPAAANGTVRKQTSVPGAQQPPATAVGGNRSSLSGRTSQSMETRY